MRVIHKDLKHGKIKLVPETLDDLWHLQHLIEEGDIVTALTWRREKAEVDKIRPERLEKKPVTLSIRVESVEFHKFANMLRVLGKIDVGPDVGKHHSLGVEPGFVLTLTKSWWPEHLERLQEAVKASRRPRVLLVALDDESAELGLVRQYGLEHVGAINYPRVGKRYASKEPSVQKFFHELAAAMGNVMEREGVRAAIVAGPGFTKEEFHKFLREGYPELAPKVRRDDVSTGGSAGLYEIVRRGLVEQVSHEDRLSFETSLMEQLMAKIANEESATYGREDVARAASLGAVEKLLIVDELLRRERARLDDLLKQVRKTRGEVIVISTEHDAGRQLLSIGGVAALLRFKIR
jgi:protein pelota